MATKILFNVLLLSFVIDLFFLEVYSYPKEFFRSDEFDDNFEDNNDYFDHQHDYDHLHNHEYHDHHHHHHHFEEQHRHLEENTLILTHVLFRHGNRTPDSFQELYPKDPYLNRTYYPFGLGQLTNAGKLREYSIGTSLRNRYSSFLNDMFLPAEVEAFSTNYNRTKASLELALAGLFPPRIQQIWNPALMWQPVPYNYMPRNQDKILMGVECPKYLALYQQVAGSFEWRDEFKKYRKVFNYISRYSGLNVTTFRDLYNLYFGLSTEQEYGLVLPQWTQKVWPKIIVNLSIKEYFVMTANDDLRKMSTGYLLKKILADTLAKISGKDNTKKIYLYSAHEINVAQFLILLDVFRPHIPNYGAHVIVEVHKINGAFGIKIFYQNYETDEPQLMKIPECEEFCKLEKFVEIFKKYIPDDNLCGN